ncbi:hypothetical protein SEEH4316_22840, partial [Salmonella enterica subsp. enterica serovar Heidelberg str. RI-11-014316]
EQDLIVARLQQDPAP